MGQTRMEKKQRHHKRLQAFVQLDGLEAPDFKSVVAWSGRLPRQDFKSYPTYAGLGQEIGLWWNA